VSLEQYRAARQHTQVACVQNSYSLADRSDQALFDACRHDAVPYVPFFPLGSAFHPENPVLTAPAVNETARRLDATPAQVALAWLLRQAPTVLLIPGHRRSTISARISQRAISFSITWRSRLFPAEPGNFLRNLSAP